MEVQYHDYSALLTSTIAISLIITVVTTTLFLLAYSNTRPSSKSKKRSLSLPPGPRKLPIIGNLHNVAAGGSLPHRTLRELSRKHGPVMHLQLGEISAVVVSSPAAAKEVMKTHDIVFAQRPQPFVNEVGAYGDLDVGFAPYGEYWRQMRKVCVLELLSVKRVRSFSLLREEEVSGMVESVRASSNMSKSVDMSGRFSELTIAVTSRSAFGKKFEDGARLASIFREGAAVAGGFCLVDVFPSLRFLRKALKGRLENIHRQLDGALQSVLDQRRLRNEDDYADLLHVLLELQRSGSLHIPITTQHIKAVIFDMFAAGSESSATLSEWTMAEMMKNPRVMKKAQAELRQTLKGKKTKIIRESDIGGSLTYLKLVIKETLRLHPPAPLLVPRESREACRVEGFDIPKNTKLIVNAWAIGRDPEIWGEDAEIFRPERFDPGSNYYDYQGTNFEYIPFGAGRRICPGISFGLAVVELALANLLYSFDWELPGGNDVDDLDMTEAFGVTVGRKQRLYLKAVPFFNIS